MDIKDNVKKIKEIKNTLAEKLPFSPGVNKLNELVRFIYEISVSEDMPVSKVLDEANIEEIAEKGKGGFFHRLKDSLVGLRYPSLEDRSHLRIMPVKFGKVNMPVRPWDGLFRPDNIYVEADVADMPWTRRFLDRFTSSRIETVNKCSDVFTRLACGNALDVYSRRIRNVFVVKNRSAFIKKCPCSNGCVRCGYWILNLGFGCPIDCSYCYLQTYNNIPGIILPANMEDYEKRLKEFDNRTPGPLRIGTGEFTDSLAFDEYTGYSTYLIPFFRDMERLVLELKTKAARIPNVLKTEPNPNVVISWSINPPHIARLYEQGASPVEERIKSASEAAARGYYVGFHFDPVIYYPGWEEDYRDIVKKLFSDPKIKRRTRWISIGTLRYTPGLKQIAEQRFADNMLFYKGEFLPDADGKLRYPPELRIKMYDSMTGWIRSMGVDAWIYLCMELVEVWEASALAGNARSFG
jgi:spore photoproduct lyase